MYLKLLKYDLKSMFKTMIPLWIALIAISVIMGVQIWLSGEQYMVMGGLIHMSSEILMLGFVALFIAVVVLNVMIIVQRFWNGLLKEEGYLMFTLPVSPRSLILSKAISSFIISMISMAAVTICIFIFMQSIFATITSEDLIRIIMESIQETDVLSVGTGNVLLVICSVILGMISSIYHIYAAMAIGHLSNKNRFLCSFGAFIGISIVLNAIDSPLTDLFITETSSFRMDMMFILVSFAIEIVIFHVITELILTYKLNLE